MNRTDDGSWRSYLPIYRDAVANERDFRTGFSLGISDAVQSSAALYLASLREATKAARAELSRRAEREALAQPRVLT